MTITHHLFPRSRSLLALGILLSSAAAIAQGQSGPAARAPAQYPLTSVDGLHLHNVAAQDVSHNGKRGLRVTEPGVSPSNAAGARNATQSSERLAVITGSDFGEGVIELEVAGAPAAGASGGARGFVGIAFRVQPDLKTYDAFYLRPTNGRADDQVRRNHSTQYISHPDWPWERLRRESPERYESYVDLEPGVWTRIRVEVQNERARLYVNGQSQPTLIVNDVKSGSGARGAVALWIGPGTEAHFRDLRVQASP